MNQQMASFLCILSWNKWKNTWSHMIISPFKDCVDLITLFFCAGKWKELFSGHPRSSSWGLSNSQRAHWDPDPAQEHLYTDPKCRHQYSNQHYSEISETYRGYGQASLSITALGYGCAGHFPYANRVSVCRYVFFIQTNIAVNELTFSFSFVLELSRGNTRFTFPARLWVPGIIVFVLNLL